ncbi:hypothetical protein ACFORG_12710 [Lutimaribacter marinistellae]|uniref:Uncharacterized protein n=1 Tax=Lutimaribacter marinistellae TaxID=1820329 RepID=A0ABV7TI90_9RHOB
MSGLRIILPLILGLAVGGHANAREDLLTLFARCSGQLSAEREHAWLMQTDSDGFERERSQFLSLVEAIAGEKSGRAALHHQIEAKHLHAALLREASFGRDPLRSRVAREQAAGRIRLCRGLLLGS